jgi:hypothetical protein
MNTEKVAAKIVDEMRPYRLDVPNERTLADSSCASSGSLTSAAT